MVFVQRSKNENSPPSETFQVGTLAVAVWVATNGNGKKRLHWKVSRVSPEGQYFRLLTPAECLQFPQLLALLAAGFASIPTLDGVLRENLKTLEALMTQADLGLRANGELHEETDADQSIFTR